MIQRYKCTLCGLHTMTEIPDEATIVAAINRLKEDHDNKVKNCPFHVKNIEIYEQPLHVVPSVKETQDDPHR